MKKFLSLALSLAIASAITLSGCKKKEEAQQPPAEQPKAEQPAQQQPAQQPAAENQTQPAANQTQQK